jgi:hypothetical protein
MRLLFVLLFMIFSIQLYAYDLAIIGVYRGTNCQVSVKVKNISDNRIPGYILSGIRIRLYGEILCRYKEPLKYERFVDLNDFFKLPNYMSTIDTGLYINTEGNCKTNLKAELMDKGGALKDDNIANNVFSKNLTGPCGY